MADNRDHERPKTNPHGVPAFSAEEVTGQYEGDELRQARARRPTDQRIERMEGKHDELRGDFKTLAAHVGDLRESVGEMSGKLEVLPKLVDAIDRASDRVAQREHVTFTAQVDVDKAGKIAKIGDEADRRKTRRWLTAKLIAAGAGLLTTWEALRWGLHHFGVL